MAGGKFYTKNKILSGFYYNVESKKVVNISTATSGVVAYCIDKPTWNNSGMHRIARDTNTLVELGYSMDSLTFITDMFMGNDERDGATEILVNIPVMQGGTKASATSNGVNIEAKYEGTRGNDIVVKIDNVDSEYIVKVYLDGAVVEKNKITSIEDYRSNYIVLSGTLSEIVATQLEGGANGTLSSTYYADFLDTLETYRFNVLCYEGTDTSIKQVISQFIEKYRDDLGRCCRAVVVKYSADYERITSVNIDNITLSNGTIKETSEIAYWVAGVESGCKGNQDLTNQAYPNAVAVSPRLTDDEQIEMINNGQLSFVEEYNEVKILSDINTLTTFTATKTKTWSYNELIRTIDEIGNDWHLYFTKYYNGKVYGVDAVSVARAYVVDYLNNMINNKYISEYVINDITYNAEDRYTSIDFYIKKEYSPDKVYCQLYV